jgi:hypothetical protein
MEAREQSSDPKPKKIQSWKGMERRKEPWRKGGGVGMKEAILHSFNR